MENNLSSTSKITIVNAHWNNRGDEAALLAIVEGLQKTYKDSQITIIFKDGKSVEQFPALEKVTYYTAKFNAKIWDIWLATLTKGILGKNYLLKKMVRTLVESDLIIYSPGGSVINKRFFWRKQMEYLAPFICAKFNNIPMMVAAPSIGPFDTSKPNILIKYLLKTPKVFCVREEISKRYLKEIGISDNIQVTIDSAFYSHVNKEYNEKKLNEYDELKQYLDSYEKVVGITITDFQWHVKLGHDKELSFRINDSFKKFLKKLESDGYGILFIPQLFANQCDYDYMNSYSSNSTFIMKDTMDTYFQQYIISKLYAVVGMRYHSNIFAAKMGIPFIAVIYEEKMKGFIELANLDEYSMSLDDLSFERLDTKFSLLDNNHPHITDILKAKLPEWRKKAETTVSLLTSQESEK